MINANHLALATPASDSVLGSVIDRASSKAEKAGRYRRCDGSAPEGGPAGLEELVMLRKRCRARELALASMAGAISTLRRANRALSEENTLLRQQVSELRERAPAERRTPDVRRRRRLVAADG